MRDTAWTHDSHTSPMTSPLHERRIAAPSSSLLALVICFAAALAAPRPASAQGFVDIGASLTGVYFSSVAWGDYDNDGDLDILLTGYDASFNIVSKIYRNDGGGAFVDIGASLTGVYISSVAWGDYDNDGDLDILLTGYTGSSYISKIYRNDGGGAFVDIGASLTGVNASSVAWGDVDNDGDLDILLTGGSSSGRISKIYRNDGGGAFVDIGASLTGVNDSSVAWGDYDNDGDLDILLTGLTGSSRISKIYRNDGGGAFVDIGASLTGVQRPSVAWGDYDNDGDLDILLTGYTGSSRISKIYRNDGGGAFVDIGASLMGVFYSSVAWGDYDNDGDLDILLTGNYTTSSYISKIYRNDGGGAFVDIGASLTGVFYSSATWGDYDNDGDLDILLTGHPGSSYISKIYRNDSAAANAVPAAPTGLTATPAAGQVTLGWSAASDGQTPAAGLTYNLRVSTAPGGVNILSPMASTSTGLRKVVQLGGAQHGTTATIGPLAGGTYYWSVQAVDTAFAGSAFASEGSFVPCSYAIDPTSASAAAGGATGSVSVTAGAVCTWSAVANDAWITVTSGASGTGNGAVGYSVAANTGPARSGIITIGGHAFTVNQASGCTWSVDPTSASAAASGSTGSVSVTSALGCSWTAVSNDAWITVTSGSTGSGNGTVGYSVAANTGPARSGTITIGGQTFTVNQVSGCSYAIDPTSASAVAGGATGSVSVTAGTGCAWTAVANDAWITVTSGASGAGNGTVGYSVAANPDAGTRVGTVSVAGNDLTVTQFGAFVDIGASLTGVYKSSVAWGDYDNDGDLDILITGYTGSSGISRIYRNDDGGAFVDIGASLTEVRYSSAAWGDYDNDGDLDILLTGYTGSSYISKIYRNDGDGVFVDIVASLPGVYQSSVAWGDYDNDGDLDILLTGLSSSGSISMIYRNDGGGAFVDSGASLTGVDQSSVAWGDVDNDGDLDILLTGYTGSSRISKIYRNEGSGTFVDIVASLTGVQGSSVAWGDYDNDGDLDILLTGSSYISKIYRNNGGGAFVDIWASLTGVSDSAVAWGDYDNDGDLDILLTGYSSSGSISKIYRNDGDGAFVDIGASLTGVFWSSVAWGDYDNDGDLDILLTGHTDSSYISKIYRNDSAAANAVPAAPTGLTATPAAGQVALGWSAASDGQTPAAGLTYNLRVSTAPGGVNILSPMASTSTGLRKVVQLGGAQHGGTANLGSLQDGLYYWSVQAVDTAFAGSPFAIEGSFVIGTCSYAIDPTSDSAAAGGATGSVSVTAGAGCLWTAVSNDAWITVSSGVSGTGNGTVGYSVAANTGPARSGTITIGGQTFTVNQASGCTWSVDPASASAAASGSTGSVSVTSALGCSWTAVSNDAWITVTSGSTGSGNGTVGYSVAANTGPARSGTITIAGETFTIDQATDQSGFYPITPCRVFDTRDSTGAPIIAEGEYRRFDIVGKCNIPSGAKAIVANVTVVNGGAVGSMSIIAGNFTSTQTTIIQIPLIRSRANNAVIQLATDGTGTIMVINNSSGTVHLILDVNGYFK